VKTRALFEILGFQEDWEAITDQRPAYFYDFGNLRLTAAQVMSDRFKPCFHLGGVIQDVRSMTMIDFEMPLEVESFEQGVAWVSYGIGKDYRPSIPTTWLDDGRTWQDYLPWVRRLEAYKGRPQCMVEKDWFKIAVKKLRSIPDSASEDDVASISFDGEILRIVCNGSTVIVPANGAPWVASYAVSASQLANLPRRLTDPVLISVWDGKISIGNGVWILA
jgi:hypothetical protein